MSEHAKPPRSRSGFRFCTLEYNFRLMSSCGRAAILAYEKHWKGGNVRLKSCYEITVRGHLPADWTDWFDGLTVTALPNGDTRLRGPVADQSALLGILWRIANLGVVLLSVAEVQP